MSKIDEILNYNKCFIANKEYIKYATSKYPEKKIAILSCMDTRLSTLLPAALGLQNGDAKIIKNAGAVVSHPFGSVMRSLLVCIYELGVEEVFVIGHYDCGMQSLNHTELTKKMIASGVSEKTISEINQSIDLEKWLCGFESVEDSIKNTVLTIRNHPLITGSINVYGLVMDPTTGEIQNLNI